MRGRSGHTCGQVAIVAYDCLRPHAKQCMQLSDSAPGADDATHDAQSMKERAEESAKEG